MVPLTSVLFAVIALTPEVGAAEMLYSQPVQRREILAGKLAGLWLALAASELMGFGAAGVVLFVRTGAGGVGSFIGVVAGSLILTAVFLSLGAAIVAGRTSDDRARGMAVALVVWFVLVLLSDVAVLGVASLLPSGLASRAAHGGGDRQSCRCRAHGDAARRGGHDRIRGGLARVPALHRGRRNGPDLAGAVGDLLGSRPPGGRDRPAAPYRYLGLVVGG